MSRANCLRVALSLLLATVGVLVAQPAAGQDLDAMTKWTAAKVVHYKIIGDFAGKVVILHGEHTLRNGMVTDHVEFEFDWDNQEMTLLGTPVMRNAPTKLGAIDPSPIEGCPPPRIAKAPEFATVTQVKAMSVLLQIEFNQQSGEGALPWISERASSKCGDLWDPSTSASLTQTVELQLPHGMMLAMPPEQSGYDLSKDAKSLLPKPENGWSWVITPSIVR